MMHVYMMASGYHGTLYIGVTNNLSQRVFSHQNGYGSRFVKKHQVMRLVWYEDYEDPSEAIAREKQLKKWHRSWKIRLIEVMNPLWSDLYLLLNR